MSLKLSLVLILLGVVESDSKIHQISGHDKNNA